MLSHGHRKRTSPLKQASRLKQIVGVFAKHGFQNLAERAKLGKFILEKFSAPEEIDKYSVAERLRMSFEQLGPTFVKFGQLLATRPDLTPKSWSEEFKKLHSNVSCLPFEEIEEVIVQHFGQQIHEIFEEVEKEPLAAASIAQVYKAKLKEGPSVVIKVQRPGIEEVIEEDLGVLFILAEMLEKYAPETAIYNPTGVVEEFAKSLELETNFVVEANNIRRFQKNFSDEDKIVIPKVYTEYTGRRVLVMEELQGIPLSHRNALEQEGIDPQSVLKVGLRAYLKMVFKYGLFHGDLHAGNMFVLPDNRVGLIDFGVVGRLNNRTQEAIANIFMALASEDYDRLAYEYIDLAPYSGFVDVDRFARDLRDLIAPYYGLSLRHLNIGRLMMDATAVAASYKLVLPSELVMFFKSIVSIEGMGQIIDRDFDFLSFTLGFSSEVLSTRYEPQRVAKNMGLVARDTNSLLAILPRQIKQLLRRLNSPDFYMQLSVKEIEAHRKGMESSAKLIFFGLVTASLILGSAILATLESQHIVLHMPLVSVLGFCVAGVMALIALFRKP